MRASFIPSIPAVRAIFNVAGGLSKFLPRRSVGAPPLPLFWRECASLVSVHWARLSRNPASCPDPLGLDGGGRRVVILPGFMASDISTLRLRSSLSASGFAVYASQMGRNTGLTAESIQQLHDIIAPIAGDGPAVLVGWSLGGLLAREYAKRYPQNVAKVITLGSPFSGCPRANNVWRIYEYVAGYKVDCPPIAVTLHEKPPVPTIAFWSPRDGIIGQSAARGQAHESDRQIELDCGHMEFMTDINAFRQIAKAILE